MSRIHSDFIYNFDATKTAFPYQLQAFMTIKDLNYSAIFHEQGLGKTKIAIDLMLYWLQYKNIDTVLIVTKKQLIQNWLDEFKIHTHIQPVVLDSNHGNNFYVFNSPSKVILTNFEIISAEKERIKLFLKARDVAIIIDESAKIKNPEAKITKDFFEISQLFKIKTIMTGTPVANRPYDIWSQIFFLDQGKSLGSDFDEFKSETDLSNDLSKDEDKQLEFENNISAIFQKISGFSIRETKDSCGIILPKKEFYTEYSEFEPKQRSLYDSIIKNLGIEINKDGESLYDDNSLALKRLLRLIQVSSNPRLVDDTYTAVSGKEIILKALLGNINNRHEKCIVWSCFIDNINYFFKEYTALNPCKIHGKMPISDRNKAVRKFKEDDTCRVMFATPQSAKEGLTLTVANNVIFYDREFNLDDYLQAQDRIHRISQKKTCHVYNIIMRDSVDQWVDSLVEAKHMAAQLSQGDIKEGADQSLIDYSYGDIIKQILSGGKIDE